eukprot:gene5450-6133_t
MKLAPRIIPGGHHALNKSTCDWGWQGLLAYGCHNFVVILDPRTVQVIQTLHHYPAAVVKVRWAGENYHHDMQSSYDLKLAAADQTGRIMIWDVAQGKLLNEFTEQGKPAVEMQWLKCTDASMSYLLVLHSPGNLILWNADLGLKLWKKSFNDPLISFVLDPFNEKNITVMSQEWIMFLSDFTTTSAPSEKGKKFYITSNAGHPTQSGTSTTQGSVNPYSSKTPSSKSAFAKMRSWAGDMRGRSDDDLASTLECLQVAYLPNNRNQFLLLFPREILILDLEFGQAIGSFAIETNSPSFVQVLPCVQRDALLCLHENGSITIKLRRSPNAIPYRHEDNPDNILSNKVIADIIYDAKSHSDVFRLSRLCRIMGFCLNPISEKEMAIVLSDGRVLFWQIVLEPVLKTATFDPNTAFDCKLTLAEMLAPLVNFSDPPISSKANTKLKFMLNGIFEGVSLNPVCLKMCPALTTKNWAVYKPLVAVGCSSGLLQIFNLADGTLYKEIAVHATAVKGIEWFNLSTLLSFAHSSSGTAKSEIQLVDIRTGQSWVLPTSRGLQESHVICIRISHQRQYFLVLFKNHHAELWDAITMSQLREFPGNFPSITAEWSPLHYSTKLRKKHSPKAEAVPSFPGSDSNVLESNNQPETKIAYTREHLVFTNAEGIVYHYVIEGTSMKDGSKVPPEGGMGVVSYIAWKGDLLVLGDVEGNINLWDLKGKLSRVFPSHRGAVRRMKFAPGKGNLKLMVLYADGIDIWESQDASILMSLKTTKDQPSVVDADWLSSDMPLLLLSDGSIRALDSTVKTSNSPILEKDLQEPMFCPRILPINHAMSLKYILQHHPWKSKYSIDYEDHEGNEHMLPLKASLENLPSEYSRRLNSVKYGTAERCCIVSQIFGDESDSVFWNVALHYLLKEHGNRFCPLHKHRDSTSQRRSSFKDVLFSDGTQGILRTNSTPKVPLLDLSSGDEASSNNTDHCICHKMILDSSLDILCDNDFYQSVQLYKIALRDSHRSTPEHTRSCAEKLILIGETDRAVQILFEADPSESSYYTDALRACLIATVRSSSASQSTIKLLATNLIANGKLAEGVELLCLVDKGLEACRYLQTYGNWELATWLAKVSLGHNDFVSVMLRLVDHLCSSHVNQKNKAILILLSLGDFTRALEVMFSKAGGRGRKLLEELSSASKSSMTTSVDETSHAANSEASSSNIMIIDYKPDLMVSNSNRIPSFNHVTFTPHKNVDIEQKERRTQHV